MGRARLAVVPQTSPGCIRPDWKSGLPRRNLAHKVLSRQCHSHLIRLHRVIVLHVVVALHIVVLHAVGRFCVLFLLFVGLC